MENFLGEIAALAAALSFSFASITFTLAGRKFGASLSMAVSLLISLVFLLPLHQLMQGQPLPLAASPQRWLLLGLSSLAGFVVSALFLLRAFQYIGPRLTLLVGATAPIFAALLAWVFLGQSLLPHAILGIALVLSGVFAVVAEGAARSFAQAPANYRRGLLMAFASALTQGLSFVLMAEGVAGDFPAMSASIIRTLVGLAILWTFIALRGQLRGALRHIVSERRALVMLSLASLTGPVLGATLVLLSLQFTSVGISSTLTGTTPILLIPISYAVFGERVTLRAVIGTLVAIGGIALLFAA